MVGLLKQAMAARRIRGKRQASSIAASLTIGTLALVLVAHPLPAQAWGGGGLSAPATAAPDEDPKIARARELAQNGGELYRDGSYDAAIDAFEAAYDLVRDPNLLYNISLAHEKAGRLDDAADALDRYRAFAPAEERDDLTARAAELRAQAASQGDTGSATASAQNDPVPEVEASEETSAVPTDEPVEMETTPEAPPSGEPLMGPVGWSLASLSVAALGTGVGLGLASVASRDAAKTNCEPGTEDPLCLSDAADDLAASKSFALGADIAYAVGAAAAIGTVVWVAVRAKKNESQRSAVRVHPQYARGFLGAGVSGRF